MEWLLWLAQKRISAQSNQITQWELEATHSGLNESGLSVPNGLSD